MVLKHDDDDEKRLVLNKTSHNLKLVNAYLLNLNLDIRDRIQLNMIVCYVIQC